MTLEPESGARREQDNRDLTLILYVLYACSVLAGVTAIIAIVINYIKQDDVAGTWLESHFRWQMRTFWFALLWGVVGALTLIVLVGWAILAANGIWCIYRIAKGILWLNDRRPMYEQQAAPSA